MMIEKLSAIYGLYEEAIEEPEPGSRPCPLLENETCPVYDIRPFGCRAMLSQADCAANGYAQMPPLALTVNHVFMQFIEHLDAGGVSGNLADLLLWQLDNNSFGQGLVNTPTVDAGAGEKQVLISNHPISGFMIPPEHRERVKPLLARLSNIVAG